MNWLQQLLAGLNFIGNLLTQLALFNMTPVGQTATITFGEGHLLEVSESGEHWVILSLVAKRVK